VFQAYGNTKLGRRLLWTALLIGGPMLFTTLCTVTAGIGSTAVPADLLFLLFAVTAGVYAVRQGVVFELLLERTWKHSFEPTGTGLIRMRCGSVAVPDAYAYPAIAAPIAHDHSRAVLRAVPVARDMNGEPWGLSIEGQHVLIAGRTGAGKNSWGWSFVFGLVPALQAGICRIYAIDPKRVELAYGKHWFYKYANDIDGMAALIQEFLAEMQARADAMEGVSRKFTPSVETPLNVLLIDELAYSTSLLPDKKLRDQATQALTTILTQGRAIGYSVYAMIQDPRKETVPNRDSFSIRIALGLPEKQLIDMVLGDGMHDKGALAEQLPLGEAGAGCGYVISEIDAKPRLLRAPWCSDADIKRTLGLP
jgi:S-DNA-T family DNA segregation ATPase FtsK/SpoIIIE